MATRRELNVQTSASETSEETIGATSNFAQDFPPGFRFCPTELDLVKFYLSPKVLGLPLPVPGMIKEIDESELYSKPPNKLEGNSFWTKEWFFFIHRDGHSQDGSASIHIVGNGKGFWKSHEDGTVIRDSDQSKIAVKSCWTYYRGRPEEGKITSWVMYEYRLQKENESNNQENMPKWTLRHIKNTADYRGSSV